MSMRCHPKWYRRGTGNRPRRDHVPKHNQMHKFFRRGHGMCSGSVRIACAYRKAGGEFRSHMAGRYVTFPCLPDCQHHHRNRRPHRNGTMTTPWRCDTSTTTTQCQQSMNRRVHPPKIVRLFKKKYFHIDYIFIQTQPLSQWHKPTWEGPSLVHSEDSDEGRGWANMPILKNCMFFLD